MNILRKWFSQFFTGGTTVKTPVVKSNFDHIKDIMQEMGFNEKITLSTLIPPKMVDSVTDELVMRSGRSVVFKAERQPMVSGMSGVCVRDLI